MKIGGLLVLLQALIHMFLGYPAISISKPKQLADILLWSWFAVGLSLASFGILGFWAATWPAQNERSALFLSLAIGAITLVILVPAALLGIGYPIIGVIGGLLLVVPALMYSVRRKR